MSQKLSQNITYWLGVIAIGLVVGLSLQFVRAWTEPAVAPPGGNIGAPVNTGDNSQLKLGNLALNTNGTYAIGLLVPNGNVGIGTAAPGQKLTVAGIIESTSGGIKFPDGTTQTTKASSAATSYLTATCRNVSCATKCAESGRSCLAALYTYDGGSSAPLNVSCDQTYSYDCANYFTCLCN